MSEWHSITDRGTYAARTADGAGAGTDRWDDNTRVMNMKNSTVTLDADGKPVDLHEPGALQALFAYRQRQFGGWKMEDDDDDDDDQDDDDDDLDDDDADDDADDDDDDDYADDRNGLTRAQRREVDREIDRRINSALRRRERRERRRGNDDDDDDRGRRGSGRRSGSRRDDDRDDEPEVSQSDAREARLVYRETVSDLVTVTRAERPIAQDLSRALIDQALRDGSDVTDAGEHAAQQVARRLKRYRRTVRDQTVKSLQAQGHLPKDFVLKAQPRKGREKPGQTKQNAETGKAIADSIYADRIPKTQQ